MYVLCSRYFSLSIVYSIVYSLPCLLEVEDSKNSLFVVYWFKCNLIFQVGRDLYLVYVCNAGGGYDGYGGY